MLISDVYHFTKRERNALDGLCVHKISGPSHISIEIQNLIVVQSLDTFFFHLKYV